MSRCLDFLIVRVLCVCVSSQLFLIEYLDDALELTSHPLPLDCKPLQSASVIDGGGLSILSHRVATPSDETSEPSSKYPPASTALIAAGFRVRGKGESRCGYCE